MALTLRPVKSARRKFCKIVVPTTSESRKRDEAEEIEPTELPET